MTLTGIESPSLVSSVVGAASAYELKFLLDEQQAREVETWARRRLTLDSHGDPALGGAYCTTSLYCDTPELDVFHRSSNWPAASAWPAPLRLASGVFLERKSKWGDRVAKRRTLVPDVELPVLAEPLSVPAWSGHWFHCGLLLRRLLPACRIQYQRTAYVGTCPESPLRLTLDRRIRGILVQEWDVAPFEEGLPLLTGQVIMEFKFQSALPALFKELVQERRLNPSCVSKYRLCREAFGSRSSEPSGTGASDGEAADA